MWVITGIVFWILKLAFVFIMVRFLTTLVHEFGHLLARKTLGWPTEYVRIPLMPQRSRTLAQVLGIRVIVGTDLHGWISWIAGASALVGPWPLPEAFLRTRPRWQSYCVIISGGLANLVQFTVTYIILRNLPVHPNAMLLWSLRFAAAWSFTNATSSVIPNLAYRGWEPDGTWFWRIICGKVSRRAQFAGSFISPLILLLSFWLVTRTT